MCARWVDAFLQGRKRRVRLGEYVTGWRKHECGVPQGTKWGPLGWIFSTEELCRVLQQLSDEAGDLLSLLYADDIALAKSVDPRDKQAVKAAVAQLQAALDLTASWAQQRNLELSPTKTEFTILGLDPAD